MQIRIQREIGTESNRSAYGCDGASTPDEPSDTLTSVSFGHGFLSTSCGYLLKLAHGMIIRVQGKDALKSSQRHQVVDSIFDGVRQQIFHHHMRRF